jgi:hypothetical protein
MLHRRSGAWGHDAATSSLLNQRAEYGKVLQLARTLRDRLLRKGGLEFCRLEKGNRNVENHSSGWRGLVS